MKSINDVQAEGAATEQAPPAEGQAGPELAGPDEYTSGTEEMTPEEQEAYDRVVLAAADILWGDNTHEQVLKMLGAEADNPPMAIANVSTMLLVQIDEQMEGGIPETILLTPLEEIIEQTGGVAAAAGIFAVDDKVLNLAAQGALEILGPQFGITPEDIQELLESIDPTERDAMVAAQSKYHEGGAQPAQQEQAPPQEQQQPTGLIAGQMQG